MDVFIYLAEQDIAVRQKAVVDLIEGVQSELIKNRKQASIDNTEVKLTSDGIELPLEYTLNRLIRGLPSKREAARQGFAAGLVLFLNTFDQISTDVVLAIAKSNYAKYANVTGNEKREYELGVVFFLVALASVDRLKQVPVKTLMNYMKSAFATKNNAPDLCSEAFFSIFNGFSLEQLNIFLPMLIEKLPKTFSEMKPYDLSFALCVYGLLHRYPSAKDLVSSTLPSYMLNILAPCNYGPIFGVLEKTFININMVGSVWKNLFNSLLHETVMSEESTIHNPSIFSVTGKTSGFVNFWNDVVHNLIAKAYHFSRKSYALTLLSSTTELLFSKISGDMEDEDMDSKYSWFSQQLNSIFLPDFTKLYMTHLKEESAPCHTQSLMVSDVLATIGASAQPIAISIIALLSNPNNGGHRRFDTKTHSTLLKTLQKSLDDEGSTLYLNTVMNTFNTANEIAKADVRAAAESTKAREEILTVEYEKIKDSDDKDMVAAKKAELDMFIDNSIGDIEEFLASDEASQTCDSMAETLQLWAVDQMVDIVKNSRLIATTLEKKLNQDRDKNIDPVARTNMVLKFVFRHAFFVAPEEPTKKSKKVNKFPAENPILDVSEKVRQSCADKYITLVTDLFNSSISEIHQNRANSEVDRVGSIWADIIYEYWGQLEANKYELSIGESELPEDSVAALLIGKNLIDSIQKDMKKNSPTEKKPFTTNDVRRGNLIRLRALYLFAIHIVILFPTDHEEYAGVITDLNEVYVRAFATKHDDEETHWIEVLTDILLSLLAKPSALLRALVLKVFGSFSANLNAATVDDILNVITTIKDDNIKAEEEEGDEDDEDEEGDMEENNFDTDAIEVTNDDSEEEEEEVDDNKLFGANDDEDEETEKEGKQISFSDFAAMLINPDLDTDTNALEQAKQEKALQELVKMRKATANNQKSIQREAMHFKLRVLDLVEVLIKKQPNSTLTLRLYDPLIIAIKNNIGSEHKALTNRIAATFINKLCRPYTMTDLPAVPDFIDSDKDTVAAVVAECDEAALEEALNAPVPEAVYVKEVLDNRFKSIKLASTQQLSMEVAAIVRLTNQYISSPPDVKEWNEVSTSISTLAPSSGKKSKKKEVVSVDKNVVLTKIRDNRVLYVSRQIHTFLVSYLFNKRSNLTHKFFSDLINKSSAIMYNPLIIGSISKAILNGPSTFIRTEALVMISDLLKQKNVVSTEVLLENLKVIHPIVKTAYESGIGALSVVADAQYVKGVKSEVDLAIKSEIGNVKVGKKKAKEGVKLGTPKVQKKYLSTLYNVYYQLVQVYRGAEIKLGQTPSLEVVKKADKKIKKESKKEETIKEEMSDSEEVIAAATKLAPSGKNTKKTKAPVEDDEDDVEIVEEEVAPKAKKARKTKKTSK